MRFISLILLVALIGSLAASAQQSHIQTAITHVQQHATSNGLSSGDVAELIITDAFISRRSGSSHVYLRQSIDGIEVVGSEMTVNVDREGKVFHTAGQMVSQLNMRISPGVPSVDALTAALRAMDLIAVSNPPSLRANELGRSESQETSFLANGIANNEVRAKLVYTQDRNQEYRLAWEVEMGLQAQSEYWLVYVDALDGHEVARVNLTVNDTWGTASYESNLSVTATSFLPIRTEEHAFTSMAPAALVGSYRVFQLPVESPNHSSPSAPSDGRTLHANPDNGTASPFGWHDTNGVPGAESTLTTGNNVDAHKGATRPNGGGSLIFDNPADFSISPINYVPAAITNTFYHSNVFHDITYQYGFDEAAGNFQENNYGNGGLGSDRINANVQASGNCNANFGTPSDGNNPTMNMYLCTTPNPDADTDFDTVVIQHEISHGISNRLTGGPGTTGCLNNAEQMGEGWSDWYGVITTIEPGDARADRRGVATYSLTGEGTTGDGIRPAPYSTNFGINGFTYQDSRFQAAPHGVGFVWATILWEVTWDMIDLHGFSADLYNAGGTAGNQIMLNLVTEGLKLQPCSPGFVDGRDAILAADVALYGGAHSDDLWAAFARRGLGFSASQGSSGTNSDNTEAFDLPPTGNAPPNAAFSFSCTDLDCDFTDQSSDSDGSVVSWSWTFGDGGSSSGQNPSYSYGSGNTYTVALQVTDNEGATDTASQSVTVTEPGGDPITLVLSSRARRGRTYVDLSWSPSDGGRVEVSRDGNFIKRTRDDGSYSDNLGRNPNSTYTYQVCETESGGDCSNVATIDLLNGELVEGGDNATMPENGIAANQLVATELLGAYPNPFNPTSTITYALAERGQVELSVYNTLGQRVALLANGVQEAGSHTAQFDASSLPSGVYVYTLRAEGQLLTGRLMLVK